MLHDRIIKGCTWWGGEIFLLFMGFLGVDLRARSLLAVPESQMKGKVKESSLLRKNEAQYDGSKRSK